MWYPLEGKAAGRLLENYLLAGEAIESVAASEAMVAELVGPFGDHALDPLLGEMSAYEAAMERLRAVSARTRRSRPWRRRGWRR